MARVRLTSLACSSTMASIAWRVSETNIHRLAPRAAVSSTMKQRTSFPSSPAETRRYHGVSAAAERGASQNTSGDGRVPFTCND